MWDDILKLLAMGMAYGANVDASWGGMSYINGRAEIEAAFWHHRDYLKQVWDYVLTTP